MAKRVEKWLFCWKVRLRACKTTKEIPLIESLFMTADLTRAHHRTHTHIHIYLHKLSFYIKQILVTIEYRKSKLWNFCQHKIHKTVISILYAKIVRLYISDLHIRDLQFWLCWAITILSHIITKYKTQSKVRRVCRIFLMFWKKSFMIFLLYGFF